MNSYPEFPEKETRLIVPGAIGGLEAIATPGKQISGDQREYDANSVEQVAIVCHPHSLMGGSMNNKVVHTVARTHRDRGHPVVRFNFRGVGESEGEYDAGIGEGDDLLAVMAWIKHCFPAAQIWLAGFSFGSFVAANALAEAINRGYAVKHLLLIAPATENYPFDRLTEFSVPLAMIYGDQDEVVDPQSIQAWFETVESGKASQCLHGAGHFFHGRLPDLKTSIETLCF